jgi:alpha-galactosidase
VAADGGSAIVCHVQLDDSTHNRGCAVRVPGLEPDATYRLSWLGPVDHTAQSMSVALPAVGPTGGATASGRDLERIGFWMPRRAPHTATLVQVERVAAT